MAGNSSSRLRLGMVGGGPGAFIGGVHRIAARLDDHYELVAGVFGSDPERSAAFAAELHVPPDRAYRDFQAMASAEAAREDGIQAVAIVTPNHLHHDVARAFLAAGIDVICDKPMTTTLDDARDLMARTREAGVVFAVTHNYSAEPMVRQMREMVRGGELGAIRLVQARYVQDWMATPLETAGVKQAEWRTDPARSGPAGCIGDIGTHAYHLASFVTGMEPNALSADVSTFVPGRRLDDNAHMLMRYESGARGILWASQVAAGNENGLSLQVYGENGGLEWHQEWPNHLRYTPQGESTRAITRAGPEARDSAARASRVPPGHPEGYLEGFAQLYTDIAELIRARREGREPAPDALLVPTVEDGARGVRFIEAALESHQAGASWVDPRLQL